MWPWSVKRRRKSCFQIHQDHRTKAALVRVEMTSKQRKKQPPPLQSHQDRHAVHSSAFCAEARAEEERAKIDKTVMAAKAEVGHLPRKAKIN